MCISGQLPVVQTQVFHGDLMELPAQPHHLPAGEEPVPAGHDDVDVLRQAVGQDAEEVHDAAIGHQVEVIDEDIVGGGTGQGETEVVHQQAGAGGVIGTRVLLQKGQTGKGKGFLNALPEDGHVVRINADPDGLHCRVFLDLFRQIPADGCGLPVAHGRNHRGQGTAPDGGQAVPEARRDVETI